MILSTKVDVVTYAHGVSVLYMRATDDNGTRGWYYELRTDNGIEEGGFELTRKACKELADIARYALTFSS